MVTAIMKPVGKNYLNHLKLVRKINSIDGEDCVVTHEHHEDTD